MPPTRPKQLCHCECMLRIVTCAPGSGIDVQQLPPMVQAWPGCQEQFGVVSWWMHWNGALVNSNPGKFG